MVLENNEVIILGQKEVFLGKVTGRRVMLLDRERDPGPIKKAYCGV